MQVTLEPTSSALDTAAESPILDPLAFLPCSPVTRYKSGQVVYAAGQPATRLYLIVEGRVKVSRQAAGSEIVVDVYQADEFFGEAALASQGNRMERAVTLENVRLMSWSREEIEEHATMRPKLGLALLQLMVRRSVDFSSRIESFSGESVSQRLTRALVRFAGRFGKEGEDGSVSMAALTHELLSQYVGTSREIVTHHMSQFRREGYLQYSRDGISLYQRALAEWQLAN